MAEAGRGRVQEGGRTDSQPDYQSVGTEQQGPCEPLPAETDQLCSLLVAAGAVEEGVSPERALLRLKR